METELAAEVLDVRSPADGVRRVLYASPLVLAGRDFEAALGEYYFLQRVDGLVARGVYFLSHFANGDTQLVDLLKLKAARRKVVVLQGAVALWKTRKEGVFLIECMLSRESLVSRARNAAKKPYTFSDDCYSRPALRQLLTVTVTRINHGETEGYLAMVDAVDPKLQRGATERDRT